MSRSAGSRTAFVLGFVVLAAATLVGNWRLDVERRTGRQTAASINNQLRLAELGLADLRGAEAAYIAAGLNSDEWMNKASVAAVQLESAVSVLAGLPSSAREARPHYELSVSLAADLTANDRKARGFVTSGQTLFASDVLFQEGAEPTKKLGVELTTVRDIEMTRFEQAATTLGWIGLGINGAALAIALLLIIVLSARGQAQEKELAVPDGLGLNPAPVARTARSSEPVVDPFVAPTMDLSGAAELCVDLGRILDGRDLPALMGRAADVLEAKGLVLWVSELNGTVLRPSIAHGYSDRVLHRMGTLQADGDNVTSLAFRTMQTQVLRGSFDGHGALAVPLITATGCVGVLAAEVQGAKPGDTRFAVARIIAAQLSTLVGPPAAASAIASK